MVKESDTAPSPFADITRAELAELLRVFIHPRTDAETLRVTTAYAALKGALPDDLAQDVARLFKEYDDKAKDRTNAIISIYKKGMADDMAGAVKVMLETTGVREEALLQVLERVGPKYPNAVQIP